MIPNKSRPAVPAGIQITWFSINQVGPNIWEKLKAQLTGKGYFSEVNLSEKDADKLISNIKKSEEFPSLKDQSGIHNEVYQNWLVDTYLDDALEKTSNQTEVKKQINKKVTNRLKRSGKKISLKRRSNYYVISPKNPRKDLEDLADDILAEILDERAFEREIIEEELEQGTFRVKLPAYIKLPPTFGYMQGDKARWEPEFESDLDAAVYFVGKTPVTTNKPKQQIVADWLLNTLNIPVQELQNHRKKILEKILETINLPGVEEEYPYVYIDTVDERFESKYAQLEEDEDEILEEQIDDDFIDDLEEDEDIEEIDENDLESRMNDAFERRLDDLINAVKEDPQQQQSTKKKKTRKSKAKSPKAKKAKKIRFLPYNTPSRSAPNFNAYLGGKLLDSFKLAAIARKNAKLAGESSKEAGFFLKKALRHEFGGDFFRRTKGTLSSNPKESEDPVLTRGQRFAALLKPSEEPPKVQSSSTSAVQLSLFGDDKPIVVNDSKLKTTIEKKTSNLSKIFDNLSNKLSSVLSTKSAAVQISSNKSSKLLDLLEKFEQVKESIINSNNSKKTVINIKKKQLDITKDNLNDAEAALNERRLEQGSDLSTTADYSFGEEEKKDNRSLLQKALDVITGDDYLTDDDYGPDIDIDLPDRNRRTPGSRRRLARRRYNAGKRKITDVIKKTSDTLSEKGGRAGKFLQRQGSKALDFGKRAGSKALDLGKSGATKAAKFITENPKMLRLGKAFGGFGTRAIPGVGIVAGGADAAYRASKGDSVGAGLAGFGAAADTLAAGSAGTIVGAPVAAVATIASWASDIALLGKDLFDIFTTPDEPAKKMSEGAIVNRGTRVMVGEAGPEAIVPLSSSGASGILSTMGMITPGLGGVATILGVTRKVLSNVGPAASPIKPIIEQIIGPLEKLYGVPSYTFNTAVGEGLGTVATAKSKMGGGFNLIEMFKKILNIDSSEDGDGTESPNNQNPAGSDAGQYKELLDMIAGVESTSMGGYDAFNRGGSAGGTVAHGSGNSTKDAIGGVVKPLTQRTVQEVMSLQASGELHATGRYQIIESTLKGLMNGNYGDTGVKPSDLYDAVTQDKLGIALIKYRLKTGATAQNFRNEWIGLQKVEDSKLQTAINNANAAFQANPNATATAVTPIAPPAITPPQPAAQPNVPSGQPTATSRNGQTQASLVSPVFSFAPQQINQPVISSPITRNEGSAAIAIINNLNSGQGAAVAPQSSFSDVASVPIEESKSSYSDIMKLRLAVT